MDSPLLPRDPTERSDITVAGNEYFMIQFSKKII